MRGFGAGLVALWLARAARGSAAMPTERDAVTRSGLRAWVDPDTPADRQMRAPTRAAGGGAWSLVMSDEFNVPGRSFRPGEDHVWTSLDKPDGVNSALEVYAHELATTACDATACFLDVRVEHANASVRVWNDYASPPHTQRVIFHYRSAMLQSWNKFCLQGGLVEVRAQLPGAVAPRAGNPDVAGGRGDTPARALAFYPTWPGVWMLGNLGRAIFSRSTHRMWPFSFDECEARAARTPRNQRISACDGAPGHGLRAFQGRGAPEIDLLEGGGTDVSASLQLAPGMPARFRALPPDPALEPGGRTDCVYSGNCRTPGANGPDLPPRVYAARRRHRSWYQGLRYAANPHCRANPRQAQRFAAVTAAMEAGGPEDNACARETCPASRDVNGDLGLLPGARADDQRWGINANGSCFAVRNAYAGAFICSPGNPRRQCVAQDGGPADKAKARAAHKDNDDEEEKEKEERDDGKEEGDDGGEDTDPEAFAYQIDAISANYGLHMAAYTSFVVFAVEWDADPFAGYVRWLVDGAAVFEVPAASIARVPQDARRRNPRKLMVQEPLYLIANVAVSSAWGARPPNPGRPCRGDGHDPVTNAVCDAFPLSLKLDYVRVYQDTGAASAMAVGCDPPTHPTRRWIADHLDEYQDDDNPVVEVAGRAFCRRDDDCSFAARSAAAARTGRCEYRRCRCVGPFWDGPRCIRPVGVAGAFPTVAGLPAGLGGVTARLLHGPPLSLSLAVGAAALALSLAAATAILARASRERRARQLWDGAELTPEPDKDKDKDKGTDKDTESKAPASPSPSPSPWSPPQAIVTLSPLLPPPWRLDATRGANTSSFAAGKSEAVAMLTPAVMLMAAVDGQDRCLRLPRRGAKKKQHQRERLRQLERQTSSAREQRDGE